MPNSQLRFEDIKVRGQRTAHDGSTFLGYASATLVLDDDIKLRIHGIQLKVVNGKFRWDCQSQGKDGVWYDTVAPASKETREVLTAALLDAYNAFLKSMQVAA